MEAFVRFANPDSGAAPCARSSWFLPVSRHPTSAPWSMSTHRKKQELTERAHVQALQRATDRCAWPSRSKRG